jgi:hypothetical protein
MAMLEFQLMRQGDRAHGGRVTCVLLLKADVIGSYARTSAPAIHGQQGDHLMPRHKQVTTCLKGGGPISKFCSCQHCTLSVCVVCGAYEGSLTTDCPGQKVDFDKQQEIYETSLDYTDESGWHLGEPMKLRSPRFATTRLPPEPPRGDPRAVVAPSIDWTRVDRTMSLQHELTLKAIAWVIADRACEEFSATLTRIEDETDRLRGRTKLDASAHELLGKLEQEKISFRIACKNAERCDLEFKQKARTIVAALETGVTTKKTPED